MSKPGKSPDIHSAVAGRGPVAHSILAILAVAALGFVEPASASASANGATDVSAARRQHMARHGAVRRDEPTIRTFRNSMNFVGTPQGSESYGYGYGDNSHNQTW